MQVVLLVALLCQAAPPAPPAGGTVIDARSATAVAGAQIAIVGERGLAARTDAAGRFRWSGEVPSLPVTFVVILADGNVARPIRIDEWPRDGELLLAVEPAVAEGVTISGVAPTIDTALGAAATFIPRPDVQLRHPATLTQSLENVPGVSAISDGGQGAVPAIRGLARGRSLLLVDGGRVSTERRAGPNASFIDPADVDSIEVARGPASVAYGSDAFGGVVTVGTRRAAFDTPLRLRVSGTAGEGVPERRGEFEMSRGFGSNAILAIVRARSFDNYHAPSGVVPDSGWRDGGVNLRWDHAGAERSWSIRWLTGIGREIGRPRSDTSSVVATTPYEDSHRLTTKYQARSAGWLRNVRVDASLDFARERTQQDRLATARQPRSVTQADTSYRDAYVRMTTDRAIGTVAVQAGADVQGVYGLQSDDRTIAYDVKGTVASIAANPSIASAHRTGVGVFTQAAVQAAPRVRFTAGIRGDAVRSANLGGYFGDRHTTNNAIAGIAGASVNLSSRATLTLQAARGFRDPTLTDRFYRGPNGRGFIEGNPDLRPETSRQFDVTARWQSSHVNVSAALYDYRIANLVERVASGGTNFFVRNRGAADLRGAEVEAEGRLSGGFALDVTAQTSRGRDADTGAPVDDIAPRALAIALRHTAGVRVSSYLRAAAVASHVEAGPSEVPTPGYVDVDAGAVWRLAPRVELRGAVRNLLNRRWYSNAGPRWVYAPGRNGTLTLTVVF